MYTGEVYTQTGERIYSLMQKYGIRPSLDASIHMLSALCTTSEFSLFVSRFDQIQSLHIFPDDFKIPDWFATRLSDTLDCCGNLLHEDMNSLLKLVTFSLRSTIAPNEEKVIEVMKMLMAKRRYVFYSTHPKGQRFFGIFKN